MRNHLLIADLTFAIAAAALAGSDDMPPPGPDGHDFGRHMFEKMDANNDGNISAEEHEQALQRMQEKRRAHFASMDKNGDGLVDKEEAKAAQENMREKFRDKRPNCPGKSE
ncbi:EF-hand domain-containing protein [Porticoccus sp.]